MRNLESRERNALEERLGKAEMSVATVWCYPSCRFPIHIPANAVYKAQEELLQKPSGSKGT